VLVLALATGAQEDPPDDRLYGRVYTSGGHVYEGYLRWSPNEGSWADFLNGNKEIPWENLREAEELDEEYGRERRRSRGIRFFGIRITWDENDDEVTSARSSIRFGHVRTLEVLSRRSAILVLKSGEEVEFRGGSSDIGRSLRALIVEDPEAGEFEGFIRWDNDEEYTWEVLDGESGGLEFDIEFGQVDTVRKLGSGGAEVRLLDGRTFELEGSNDVDSDNKGIFVEQDDGTTVLVRWEDFDQMKLAR